MKNYLSGGRAWLSADVPNRYLYGLLVVCVVGFFIIFLAYLYVEPQPQPVPTVTVVNGTDVEIIAEVPSAVTILPLKAPRLLNITVYVIPLRSLSNITVVLGSNLSRLYTSTEFEEVSLGPTSSEWTAQVGIANSGTVETINETLTVLVVSQDSETSIGSNSTSAQSVDLPIKIAMSDFPNYFYLFILALGVILSRLTPLIPGASIVKSPPVTGAPSKNNVWDLVWIPFSVVVSLLIFSAFRQQVTLTTDLVENFALAFGFGFAFEKALSSAPAKAQ